MLISCPLFKMLQLNLHRLLVGLVTEQKDKLSEVEQQLKKAEAAQRRRTQVEKAARESEVCPSWFFNCISLWKPF